MVLMGDLKGCTKSPAWDLKGLRADQASSYELASWKRGLRRKVFICKYCWIGSKFAYTIQRLEVGPFWYDMFENFIRSMQAACRSASGCN